MNCAKGLFVLLFVAAAMWAVVDARWHQARYSSFCGYNIINSDEMLFTNYRSGFTFELRTAMGEIEQNIHLACRSNFQRELSCRLTNDLDRCSTGFEPTILLMYSYINGELYEVTPITIINIIDRFNIYHVKHNTNEKLAISNASKDVVGQKVFELVTAYNEPISAYQYPREVYIQTRNSASAPNMYKCLLVEKYQDPNYYRIVYNKNNSECKNVNLFALDKSQLNFQIIVRYTAFPYVTDVVHSTLEVAA